ncbi:hypothetical protein LEP1GSC088_3984 [Leptospira interrogans str. L1207]|nr:hypothetical protein LEP1GSC088_3984 [Leptospira interrogans str. L1207]
MIHNPTGKKLFMKIIEIFIKRAAEIDPFLRFKTSFLLLKELLK